MARKCRFCRTELPAKKDSDRWQAAGFCSLDHMAQHGLAKAKEQRERIKRKDIQRRKLKLRTKGDAAKTAQAAFNKWIRLRDAGLPCVSCGRPDDGTHQRHASHYRSRGAHPELAFHPNNVHASCAQCNAILSGNIVEYRIGLVKKIGQDRVDWLEGPHDPAKLTIEDLDEITENYRKLARGMQRRTIA